eukprot:30828-Pelagococcus_subviridis.AAC.24
MSASQSPESSLLTAVSSFLTPTAPAGAILSPAFAPGADVILSLFSLEKEKKTLRLRLPRRRDTTTTRGFRACARSRAERVLEETRDDTRGVLHARAGSYAARRTGECSSSSNSTNDIISCESISLARGGLTVCEP